MIPAPIARAWAAQQRGRGVPVRVRLPSSLAARARACAADIGDTLEDWVFLCCANSQKIVLSGVVKPETMEKVTRRDSVSVTVRAPPGISSAEIRSAIHKGCAYAEAKRVPCTPQPVAGYKVEEWR